jgi:hypothetical protein
MNQALKITLLVLAILVLAGGLVFAGSLIGRRATLVSWMHPGVGVQAGGSITGRGYGPGMMNGNAYGRGMMGTGQGYGPGMMSGGYTSGVQTPLTTDQAYQAASKYLAALNNPDLKIAEVMVFDNNAYVRVVEQGTGIGAFELLVDPATQVAYPEPGPDVMWNLKYGGLNHQNMMGGRASMMGSYTSGSVPTNVSAEMTVSAAQALQAAQTYLDTALPGDKTAADADPFYGYYTIDILRDGATAGMLSVNGFSGQVFLHTWHGSFVAARDY